MRVWLFLLAVCVQVAGEPNILSSENQDGSISNDYKASLPTPRVMTTYDILSCITPFIPLPELLKFMLASKPCYDASRHWPIAVIRSAGLPYADGVSPTPEDWRLAILLDGCMKGRSDQIFVPGSTVLPVRPEHVEHAVESVASDSSISLEDKALYFDRLGMFLCMQKHYESLDRLLSTVPLECSERMKWPALHMWHIPYELAKVNPFSMLRIVNTVPVRLRVKLFTGILSVRMGSVLICKNLNSTRNVDSVRAALMAVGKSCLSPLADFFIDSHDALERNRELVRRFTDLLPDGDQSQCSESTFAHLLNDIRFAPDALSPENVLSRISVICNQSKELQFRDAIGRASGATRCNLNTSNPYEVEKIVKNIGKRAVDDVLVAVMHSQKHDLFQQFLVKHPASIPTESIKSVIDFPDFFKHLSFEECHLLLCENLDPQDKLRFIRNRRDFLAQFSAAFRMFQCSLHLIIEMELYPVSEYKKLIDAFVLREPTEVWGLHGVLDYLVGIFSKPADLDLFVYILERWIKCFKTSIDIDGRPSIPVLRGTSNLLCALLLAKISDEQMTTLTEAMTEKGFEIRLNPQGIHALLNDSALAEAMSTERGRLISNWISTEVLTRGLGLEFDLSESQIMRLLEIFNVELSKDSFIFQDKISASTWLDENARTFGAMARSAAKPGFMAHFIYSVFTTENRSYTYAFDAFSFPARNIIEDINYRSSNTNNFKLFSGECQSYSMNNTLAAPNPLLLKNFNLLNIWYLKNKASFTQFAPPLAARAFEPVPVMMIFDEILTAEVLTDVHRRKAEVYLSNVTLSLDFASQEELDEFREGVSHVSRLLKYVDCELELRLR